MTKKVKSCIVAILAVAVLVILDQVTKLLALWHLNPQIGGSDVVWWDGVFRLHYLENRGAAFGVLQGQKAILVVITIIVFLAICWIYTKIPNEKHFRGLQGVAIFIMAGAIGNFIDRIRFGYVIDFFYFELIDFPVFNVADIYVTCSMVVFILLFLFFYKEADLERILPSKKKEGK